LNGVQPPNDDNPGEPHNGSAANFSAPCYALPENPGAAGWVNISNLGDDGWIDVTLGFTFPFYGTPFSAALIHTNGILTFGEGYPFFFSNSFDMYSPSMVAPFWADVDVRGGVGTIWYKKFAGHLAVVWDRVGFAYGGNIPYKRNTFQVVIGDGVSERLGNSPEGGKNNICFCYVDMDWWTGRYNPFFSTAANVGVKNAQTDMYTQIGRFQGVGSNSSVQGSETFYGIDWLDFKGANFPGENSLQGICLTAVGENQPPVAMGFPADDTYTIPCNGVLDLVLTFGPPELDQTISLALPDNFPPGLTHEVSSGDNDVTVQVRLNWVPDFSTQSGSYVMTFVATDSFVIQSTITKTLKILVASCGDQDDLPEQCVEIENSECTSHPGPYCTPYRSPEHCPLDESFPMYIRNRYQIMRDSPDTFESLGYWFQLLEDKAASYAFTTFYGYHAPPLLCCAEPGNWLETCFPDGHGLSSFVIRAVGSSHSSSAVYVLPSGFDGPELTRPEPAMSAQQVLENINGLTIPPSKIIVEEFIPRSEETLLPDEYKVHAFNGEVGSISMILNRRTDCACYAEVDENWERLDRYGCFVPNMPFGEEYGQGIEICYEIDFEKGARHAFPMKGHDFCGKLPLPKPGCILGEIVRIAKEISAIIGVYVRIDFFVTADGKIFIQEYTFNHNNGLRHCAARKTDTACIDSCFLGRIWKERSGVDGSEAGGPVTSRPSIFDGWVTNSGQCATAMALSPPETHESCLSR
jgi:hypothetical protein